MKMNMKYTVYQMKHGKKSSLDLSSRNTTVAPYKEIMYKDGYHDAN